MKNILLGRDLTGRVRFETEPGVFGIHAVAVIGNGDQALSGTFHTHDNPFRVGVKRVFDEFLDDGSRTFDHFSGGDFVGDLIGENFDEAHGLRSPSFFFASRISCWNSCVLRILSNAGSQLSSTSSGPSRTAALRRKSSAILVLLARE